MRTIIPGPPGTGKTYRLVNHYLNIELNENKVEGKKILYVSFSKAATQEAKKRIYDLYPMCEVQVSTLHALGVKHLNLDTNNNLLKGKAWEKFKLYCGVDVNIDGIENESGMRQYKDYRMRVIEYATNKDIKLEEAQEELGLQDRTDLHTRKLRHRNNPDTQRRGGIRPMSTEAKQAIKQYYCPIIPTIITANARINMYHAFSQYNPKNLCYTDTDSIIASGTIPKTIQLGNQPGDFTIKTANQPIVTGKQRFFGLYWLNA